MVLSFLNESMFYPMCFTPSLRPLFQICPICAALPGGDPNHVTDDFTAHLTLEHRAPRDLISFLLCRTPLRVCVCLCGVRSLCRFHLNGLRITTSRAAFDMYAGCSTRAEDWAAPERGGPICTLLAAPRGGSHPRRRRAPPTLPATEKQWTQSQVSCIPVSIPQPSTTQHNLMCFYVHVHVFYFEFNWSSWMSISCFYMLQCVCIKMSCIKMFTTLYISLKIGTPQKKLSNKQLKSLVCVWFELV